MMDFYEGWDLYQRLMHDGYLPTECNIEDGKEMMIKIYDLAYEHYDWKPAEPCSPANPSKEYREFLEQQTPETRLSHIYDIAIDWDGYRDIRGLGGLVDEIISCTIPPCKSEHDVLEEVKATKKFNDIYEFLNINVKEDKLPFSWNFDVDDLRNVKKWCKEHNYVYTINDANRATSREKIGYPVTIKKGFDENDSIQEKEA